MVRKYVLASVAALGLVTTSAIAQASAPVAAPVTGESQLGGDNSGGTLALIGVLAVLLVGALTLIDDDEPVSP